MTQPQRRPPLVPPRPAWLTGGMIRLGILCLFVALVGMLRPRLTPERAWWLVGVGGAVMVAGFVLFVLATRWLTVRGPFEYAMTAALHLLRRIGLPLLGLGLFLLWTFVYMGLWAYRPHGSFVGLALRPRFADFFYYSVSTALISPPGDSSAREGRALSGRPLTTYADTTYGVSGELRGLAAAASGR